LHLPNSAFLGNIEGFIRGFDPDEPAGLKVTMHDRWVAVHPMVLSMTAALGRSVIRDGGAVQVGVEEIRSLPYLIRLGLFQQLDVDPGVEITEHEESGRFIPLSEVRSGHQLSEFLVDMVPLLHATPEQAASIKYVVSELVRNVLEHANSPVGAVVCAQYFRGTRRLAIGVADTGVGILASMRRAHGVADATQAIRLALRPGVTGTTAAFGGTEYNAGAGLFFVKGIANASRNFFVIYSGDAMFKLRKTRAGQAPTLQPDPEYDTATWRAELPIWPGTAVGIDLSIEETIEFGDLLAQVRAAYFHDVDRRRRQFKAPRFE
jgi:anti-sigma regulatory factor (Ser/Thr protein kinase)